MSKLVQQPIGKRKITTERAPHNNMSQVQVSKLAGVAQTLGQITVSPGHTLNVEGKL